MLEAATLHRGPTYGSGECFSWVSVEDDSATPSRSLAGCQNTEMAGKSDVCGSVEIDFFERCDIGDDSRGRPPGGVIKNKRNSMQRFLEHLQCVLSF